MKEQLEKLKNLLKEESELEEVRKPINKRLAEIKKIKEGLLEEVTKVMKTDNYSTEFCTIMRNKKLAIEVIDEEKAMEYMKAETIVSVDEAKVEEVFKAMYRADSDELQSAEFSGLKVSEFYKPQVRKKKDGLEE
ncbi:MAG TPA: hypothetical protein VKZ95_06265 [Sphingobacteriaceae bacterium]|nr:hypothetical protein [Sphingobacteriaceae bacterium]